MSGSDKLPLLVIGNYSKPRYFKGVQTLPVQYEANKKARMLSQIFTYWLTKLDRKFMQDSRKVAIIVITVHLTQNFNHNLRQLD